MKLTLPNGWEVSDAEAKLLLEQLLAQMIEGQEDITDLSTESGGESVLKVHNPVGSDIADQILTQLKIMNLYLSILTNEEIKV